MATLRQVIWSTYYPVWGTPIHGTLEDSGRWKRLAICNLWQFCKQTKITFSKTTHQMGSDLDNSLEVHTEKHPEIVELGRKLFPAKKACKDTVLYLLAMRYLAKYLLRKMLREGYVCEVKSNVLKSAFTFIYEDATYVLVVERVVSGNKYLCLINGVTCYRKS